MAAPDLSNPVVQARRSLARRLVIRIYLILLGFCCLLAPFAGVLPHFILDLKNVWTHEEVARATSPSGRVDAVLYEKTHHQTTSYCYEVWIINIGASVSPSEASRHRRHAYICGVIRNSHASGANLRWETAGTLVVEYKEAREVFQHMPKVRVGDQTVRVVLQPGVEDPSAPAGGMLHNRERAARAGDPRSKSVLPAGEWIETRQPRAAAGAAQPTRPGFGMGPGTARGRTGRPLGDRPV